jgi:hypothetical protein
MMQAAKHQARERVEFIGQYQSVLANLRAWEQERVSYR